MNRLLGWLVTGCVLALLGTYMWKHREHVASAVAAPTATPDASAQPNYDEVREAQRAVTLAGPLANYVARQKPSDVETLKPVETSKPIVHKVSASDHVGESPVGTSADLLHQTFAVAKAVNLPFEVPAHAANPQLRGTYRSFVKRSGTLSSGDTANVEFLLLNEQQYGEFLNGHDVEAVFAAEDAHNQEVNTSLPPTLDQPAQYHLVFRNNSREAAKKVVEANFRIDF